MDDKKTFGAYILKRRKELGLTQREFAEQLFVTESAVSKWERGLSYPDITLLLSICNILDISANELLTGSEDTKQRNSERLATKYLRITRNQRIAQYVFYGIVLLICAIVNISTRHSLDWFPIALFAVLMCASITLAPLIAAVFPKTEHCKVPIALGGFTLFLELLLLASCIYSGGAWFPIAAIAVLFGLSLVLLPFMLPTLPLPAWLAERKASAYLIFETALLLLLILVCTGFTRNYVISLISIIFGLGFVFLPLILRQAALPQDSEKHKTLIYFSVQTILLFVLMAVVDASSFLALSLPSALACLVLPWGIMLTIRYLRVNGFFKASICTAWTAAWLCLFPLVEDSITSAYYGWPRNSSISLPVDFSNWEDVSVYSANVFAIILIALGVSALTLLVLGIRRQKQNMK